MPPPAEGLAARFVLGPALRTQPDRRLVTLVRDGYETAFEEIVRRYGKPLTRYAAAIVGGRAEDVTQDAFSKALLALRRDDAEIELRPWLFRIVRNTALNDLRDRPPSAEALAEVIAGGRSPAEELERREELTDLMQRLQALPEPQRAAIVMRELEGLSHEEIAKTLGLSGGAARQAIYRARRTLRDSAGMLLPLPLLKALLAGAASAPIEAATGAAGLGGAAGAGVTIKAVTATVLVAGAVGAGVAIDHNRHASSPEPARASGVVADDSAEGPSAAAALGSEAEDDSGEDRGGGHSGEDGSNHRGSGDDGNNRGPGGSGGERHPEASGPSGHGEVEGGEDGGGRRSGHGSGDSSGPGGSSGSGSGPSGGGDGSLADNSGPGSTSSGGDSGSGSEEAPESNSGPGSGGEEGSLSGDGSADSSGSSGSGDSGGGDGFSLQTEPQS